MNMPSSSAPARVVLDVNLSTIADNFKKIKEGVAPLGVIAALKANGYGLGMPEIARRLGEVGVSGIATAELAEALEALEATAGKIPVGILGTLLPDEIAPSIQAGIRIPLAGFEEAKTISETAGKLGKEAICHFAIDTGMSRVGIRLDEAYEVITRIASLPHLRLEGMYSHFPTANIPEDAATIAQVKAFKELAARLAVSGITLPVLHIANSDGINNVPESYCPPFTHVRTGINLYGSFDPLGNRRLRVKPVFTLRARLAQVRHVKAGATLGYGRTFTAPRDMLVGTVAAGYADGLPLALSNRGSILVHGVLCPVIGRICMDFSTISLEQVPDAKAGDEAVCLGRQGNAEVPIDTWATLKGTHAYEVLCAIGSRVKRNYVD